MKTLTSILIVLALLITYANSSFARHQSVTSKRTIHVNFPDKQIDAQISTTKKKAPAPHLKYYWYDNSTIHETQGDYSGYLLDGFYTEYFNVDNGLSAKGTIKRGVRHGIWKYWYPNGNLKAREKWQRGKLRGKKYRYDTKGTVEKIEHYKSGRLTGRVSTFDTSGSKTSVYYKNGSIVQHVSFTKRIAKLLKHNRAVEKSAVRTTNNLKANKLAPKAILKHLKDVLRKVRPSHKSNQMTNGTQVAK